MTRRPFRRRFRLWSLVAIASSAFTNRRDIARWVRFVRRAVGERQRRPLSELLTEAKVRLALTTDPLLRRDPSLDDLSVEHGVVTLYMSGERWPEAVDRIDRLKQVKGITDVRSALPSLKPRPNVDLMGRQHAV